MKQVTLQDKQFHALYKKVVNRLNEGASASSAVEKTVRKILDDIRKKGDPALIRYTEKFDRLRLIPSQLRVDERDVKRAYLKVSTALVKSLEYARDRIVAYHEKQKVNGFVIQKDGVYLEQRVHPIERVGLYVPGGRAAYPSSVLMNAIPARLAGVPKPVLCSPTPEGVTSPALLVAADLCGITEIYRVGGAQAIGALCYGTATLPKVDKIVGPGNQYVAMAKRLVYGKVAIDMIAGPSELLIIADDSAHPAYVASDLLSQAEHDEEAVVIFLCPSSTFAKRVEQEMALQQKSLPRKKIIATALAKHGVTFIVPDLEQAIDMANEIAPEHLSIFVKKPFLWLDKIVHAGSVFLGEMTPQSLGDYVAGPSHVLPTGGTARFSSPLSVDDFVRKSSVIAYTEDALRKGGPHLVRIAEAEQLQAHANMVTIRTKTHA